MSAVPRFPGVHVQEAAGGVPVITPAPTSVTGVVDRFERGPADTPVRVTSWSEVERTFGGLSPISPASYALQLFFANGGQVARVVRVAPGAATASVAAQTRDDGTGVDALVLAAASPGTWGNAIRATIRPRTASTFDLAVRRCDLHDGRERVAEQALHRDLSASRADARFVDAVVNPAPGDIAGLATALILVTGADGRLPLATGTVGLPRDAAATLAIAAAMAGGAPALLDVGLASSAGDLEARTIDLGSAAITTLEDAAARLQDALRSSTPGAGGTAGRVEFTDATVTVTPTRALQITPGTGADASVRLWFGDHQGSAPLATLLGIAAGAPGVTSNVAAYQVGSPTASRAQGAGTEGTEGDPADAAAVIGAPGTSPTGLAALDGADDLNLLCLPRVSEGIVTPGAAGRGDAGFPDDEVDLALSAAIALCERRRAMLLVDPPTGATTPAAIRTWVQSHSTLRHRNVAIHFPRLVVADPHAGPGERSIGTSGAIAGLYSRTDASRGVWRAPAGVDATIRGIKRLESLLTDDDNGTLNALAINCLRRFDRHGTVNWGSRTAVGVDAAASEWTYVPVRRLALFLEETLARGTTWVVHEPNGEPLWAQVRLSVTSLMEDLFRRGAFAGRRPAEAYVVRCDASTMTAADRQRGTVRVVVGFAPLRPAEFVVLSIEQATGSAAA